MIDQSQQSFKMNENKFFKNFILIGFMTLFHALSSSAGKMQNLWQNSTLESLFTRSYQKGVNYLAPTKNEQGQAQKLFIKILQNNSFDDENKGSWQEIGFKIEKIKDGDNSYIVIRENPETKPAGRGFYIIKTDNNSSNILQAPHRPTDEQTHKIIFKMLLEGDYRAASWNTVTRKTIDLAKEPNSYFNAFTKAVAISFDQPKIMQLHAFDAAAHEIDGDMILSSTTYNPSLNYKNIADCLKSSNNFKNFKILKFPYDIKELGGTRNINAKLFYEQNPKAQFFHIETSMRLRLALLNEEDLRNQFSQCFIKNFHWNLNNA